RQTPETPAIDGAVVALGVVLCVLSLGVWVVNPVAAALLVPALHLWLWLGSPIVERRWQMATIVLAGLLPGLLVLIYYALALGLAPWSVIWSVCLLIAGGGMALSAGIAWCVALGTVASGIVLAIRAVREEQEPAVTVRGPASYAGPGSLGGTESALKR
ncbi:MAG: hypothetical protein J2O48_09895, partial [Solirubrobacterales bacterium]|nr:hypothetical protein [Solirubrobacterales bacterium]